MRKLPVDQFKEQLTMLQEDLTAGNIDEKTFRKEKDRIQKNAMLFIARTNAGKNPGIKIDNKEIAKHIARQKDQQLADMAFDALKSFEENEESTEINQAPEEQADEPAG